MQRRKLVIGALCVVVGISALAVRLNSVNHEKHEKKALSHFMAADRLQKQGRLLEAIEEMKRAIVEQPDYFEARLGLADFYQSVNRFPEGIKVLKEGMSLAPKERIQYLRALANEYQSIRDFPQAIAYIRQCVQQEPENALYERQLGGLLERTGQWEEAESTWQTFAKHHPNAGSGQRGMERTRKKREELSRKPPNS